MEFNFAQRKRPTPIQVLKISLPRRRDRAEYVQALVDKFGIKALVQAGFPGGKKAIRRMIENG